MNWKVESYIGVGPIKFGMDSSEIARILGPSENTTNRQTSVIEYRAGMESPIIAYRKGKVSEITFTRFTENVNINGINYYDTNPAVFANKMCEIDSALRVFEDGNYLSIKLGISFDQYELDDSDKSITIFEHGVFDELLSDTVAYVAQ